MEMPFSFALISITNTVLGFENLFGLSEERNSEIVTGGGNAFND